MLRARELARVLEQAEVLGVFDLRALRDQIARNPGRIGAARLARVLDRWEVDLGAVWSEFEAAMLGAIEATDIPRPVSNQWIVLDDGGPAIRPDMMWRRQQVVVLPDGWRFHRPRAAFERNTRDDQRLVVAGWPPVRVTWWQLRDERERVVRLVVDLVRERTRVAA